MAILLASTIVSILPLQPATANTTVDNVTWGVNVGQVFQWDVNESAHVNTMPPLTSPVNASGLWNTTITALGNFTLNQVPGGNVSNGPFSCCNASEEYYNSASSTWTYIASNNAVGAMNLTDNVSVQADWYFMLLVVPLVHGVLNTSVINASVVNFFAYYGYSAKPDINTVTPNSVAIAYNDGTSWNATYDVNGVATVYNEYFTNQFVNDLGFTGTGEFMLRHVARSYIPAPVLAPITPARTGNNAVSLSWNTVANANYYEIYRDTSYITVVSPAILLNSYVLTNSYTDDLSYGSYGTYYYDVVASGNTGNSAISNCVSVYYGATPLSPSLNPISPSQSSTGDISLSWSNTGADNYSVYRSTSPINGNVMGATLIASGLTGTTYMDTVTSGGQYYYAIMAYMNGIGSNPSNSQNVQVNIPQQPPSAPVLSSITPSTSTNGSILLKWNSVSGANSYNIYRDTKNITSVSGLIPIATGISGTSYTDNVYTNGTFYYVVVAVNGGGTSPLSNCSSVVVSLPPSLFGVYPGQQYFWSMTASAYIAGLSLLNATGLWNTNVTSIGNSSLGGHGPANPAYDPYDVVMANTSFFNSTSDEWVSVDTESAVTAINVTAMYATLADQDFFLLFAPLNHGTPNMTLVNASMIAFFKGVGETSRVTDTMTSTSVTIIFSDGTAWNATYDSNGVATSYYFHLSNAAINGLLGGSTSGQFLTRQAVRATMTVKNNGAASYAFPVGSHVLPVLNWTVTCNAPPAYPTYTIYVNGQSFITGSWTSGTPITLDLSLAALMGHALEVGNYSVTLVATGCGTGSNTLNLTVYNAPLPPLLAAISPSISPTGSIFLNWSSVPGASFYLVYRATSIITTVAGLTPIANLTATTFTDSITADGTFYYVVVAVNATSASAISNVEFVTVAIPPVLPLSGTQLFEIGFGGVIGLMVVALVVEGVLKRRK